MVELHATTQKESKTLLHWKYAVPPGPVTLGRILPHCDWAVPGDELISKRHAKISWEEAANRLFVQVVATARNPAYYQGQMYPAGTKFFVEPGQCFIIGGTVFSLVKMAEPIHGPDDNPTFDGERTCSNQELRAISYADADSRIEVLSLLPEMIRQSPSDSEFDERLVEVLLQGMPRAHTAALVWIDPATATPASEVRVQKEAIRPSIMQPPHVSRRLVHSAVCKNRQTVLHHWGDESESDSGLHNLSLGVGQWGICAPLADNATSGWALYVAGADLEMRSSTGPTRAQLQDSDLKFVATVAEVVGALRALRDLQKQQAVLSRFFSPAVMGALAGQDIEAVLKPRISDVTVLCCDLRGSCRIAEEGESDLAATCDRVSAALEEMTTRITEADGIISDFQGDAAMAFWGWPQRRANDAEQAARAALAINRGFTLLAARPGSPLAGFACGLGLASGPGVAGRLGTIDQFKIGVFGPTINLAARLEGLTKLFRVPVLADDSTALRLKGKAQFRLRRLALVRPYGMTKQLLIHEILAPIGAGEGKALSENQRLDYEAALDKFTAGAWEKADLILAKLRSDGPSQFLRSFMSEQKLRPPNDWTGVIVPGGK